MSQVLTLPAQYDVYIDMSEPNSNFDNSKKLWMGYFCGNMEYRTLLKFDLASIPDDADIISAKLNLFIDYSPASWITANITPYIITGNWNQETVTWENAPPFDTLVGGATVSVKDTGWYVWDVYSIVDAWMKENYSNKGIILINSEKTLFDNKRAVSSRDYSHCHITHHPTLTIEYRVVHTSKDVILEGRRFTESYLTVQTNDNFLCTPGFDTSQKSMYTFFAKNQGNSSAIVVLEISPNNVDYMVDGKEIEVLPGSLRFAVPYVFAKYTRLCYKSGNTGESTSLYIAYQAQV